MTAAFVIGVSSFGLRFAHIGKEQTDVLLLALKCMADFVLANSRISSNQSGDSPARIAIKTPKAKPQNMPRQRDIQLAIIQADIINYGWKQGFSSAAEKTVLAMPS